MITSLLVSQVGLWIIVIALGLLCLALTRQIGVLHERIAPMGALSMNRRLAGGHQAPQLTLKTLAGEDLVVAARAGTQIARAQLLFFLSPSCPICKSLLPVLRSVRDRERSWLSVILASDGGDISSHQQFVLKYGLGAFPYVLSQELGLTYGVSKLPYAVLISEKGLISGLGLVNSREQIESLFEARRLGQSTLQAYLEEDDRREASDERQGA